MLLRYSHSLQSGIMMQSVPAKKCLKNTNFASGKQNALLIPNVFFLASLQNCFS